MGEAVPAGEAQHDGTAQPHGSREQRTLAMAKEIESRWGTDPALTELAAMAAQWEIALSLGVIADSLTRREGLHL